jgi:hypothetical protein
MSTKTPYGDNKPIFFKRQRGGGRGTFRTGWEMKFRCDCDQKVRMTSYLREEKNARRKAFDRLNFDVLAAHGRCLRKEVIVDDAEEPSAASPPRFRPRIAAQYPTPGKDNFPHQAAAEAEPAAQFAVSEGMTETEENSDLMGLKLRSRNQLFPPESIQQSPLRDRSDESLRLRDARRSTGCVSVRNPSPSPR